MKALLAVTLVMTSAPALAAETNSDNSASSQRERKYCARVEQRGGSRVSRRVCLTEAQWRERYGNDWRIELTGRNPEDDIETMEARTHITTEQPGGLAGPGTPN